MIAGRRRGVLADLLWELFAVAAVLALLAAWFARPAAAQTDTTVAALVLEDVTIQLGDSVLMDVTPRDSAGFDLPARPWSDYLLDPRAHRGDIVTVRDNGWIIPNGIGTATLHASLRGTTIFAAATVHVTDSTPPPPQEDPPASTFVDSIAFVIVHRPSPAAGGQAIDHIRIHAPTHPAPPYDLPYHLWPGDTITLVAEALDAAGAVIPGVRFFWQSTDPAVLSVDSAGLVTALPIPAATDSVPARITVHVVLPIDVDEDELEGAHLAVMAVPGVAPPGTRVVVRTRLGDGVLLAAGLLATLAVTAWRRERRGAL